MRRTIFVPGEYYHIYNRGVDKRNIFMDEEDLLRFLESIKEFNVVEPIGSIYEKARSKKEKDKKDQFGGLASKNGKLVNVIAYCLNQNHYHFILEPLIDDGVQKFMHRLSTGYTMYFNEKYERTGSLFQGSYKSVHIKENNYLLHLSVYVNLNDRVHKNLNRPWLKKFNFSSFREYSENGFKSFCKKDIILGQFKSKADYQKYAEEVLHGIIRRKEEEKEFKTLAID